MDALYIGIKAILDGLIPSAELSTFQGLNDVLAYGLTIVMIWGIILKPVLKLMKVVK